MTNLPTRAPTPIPTPAPIVNTLGMCTKVGDGICVDSLDHTYYAFASNGGVLSGVPGIDETIATNFCSQKRTLQGILELLSSLA